jgi:hypothetical protein
MLRSYCATHIAAQRERDSEDRASQRREPRALRSPARGLPAVAHRRSALVELAIASAPHVAHHQASGSAHDHSTARCRRQPSPPDHRSAKTAHADT